LCWCTFLHSRSPCNAEETARKSVWFPEEGYFFSVSPENFSVYLEFQIIEIDDHIGVAISGLTSDARVLSRYMRNECVNHKYVFNTPMITGRLVRKVADSMGCRNPFRFILILFSCFRIPSAHPTSWSPSVRCWPSCHRL
jgi:hypothetical protein